MRKKKLTFDLLEQIAEDLWYHHMKRENKIIEYSYQHLNEFTRATYRQLAEISIKKWEEQT